MFNRNKEMSKMFGSLWNGTGKEMIIMIPDAVEAQKMSIIFIF